MNTQNQSAQTTDNTEATGNTAVADQAQGQTENKEAGANATTTENKDGAGNNNQKTGDENQKDEKAGETKGGENTEAKEVAIELSEGSLLQPGTLDKLKNLVKDKGYTQEQATELLAGQEAAVADYVNSQKEMLAKTNAEVWVNELKADKQIGGADYEANMHLAARTLERFVGKDAVELLKSQNLNHNPFLVRFAVSVGKASQDDKIVTGGNNAVQQKTTAEKLYGNSANK